MARVVPSNSRLTWLLDQGSFVDLKTASAPSAGLNQFPTASDAIKTISTDITGGRELMPRMDTRSDNRTAEEFFTGLSQAEATVSAYLLPPNTAGNQPDTRDLLDQIFDKTLNVGDVTYTMKALSDNMVTSGLALFVKYDYGHWGACFNSVIEGFAIAMANKEPTTCNFTMKGIGASILVTPTTMLANAAPAATVLSVVNAENVLSNWFNILGSAVKIKIGTEDNGGAGYTIVSVAGTVLTILEPLANGVTAGDAVVTLAPGRTLQSDWVTSGPMNVMINAVNYPAQSANFNFATIASARDDEAGFYGVSGGTRDKYKLTCELTFKADDANSLLMLQALAGSVGTAFDIALNSKQIGGPGSPASRAVRVLMPQAVVLEKSGTLAITDGQTSLFTMTFDAVNSPGATTEDSFTMVIGTI